MVEISWKQTRWLGAMIANMSGKMLKRRLHEQDFMKLPSDLPLMDEIMSKERYEFLKKKWSN